LLIHYGQSDFHPQLNEQLLLEFVGDRPVVWKSYSQTSIAE